jgi:hypothetical protein
MMLVGVALLASALWGRSKPGFLWIVVALLLMVLGWALRQFAGGFVGEVIPGGGWAKVFLLFAVVVVILDVLADRKLDKKGAVALVSIPVLAFLAGGETAALLNRLYSSVYDSAVSVFSSL